MGLFSFFFIFWICADFAPAQQTCTVVEKVDIAIVVQLNAPVQENSTDNVKSYIRENLKDFLIDYDHTRVGLVQFTPNPNIEWSFQDNVNRAEFEDALENLDLKETGSGTVMEALIFAVFHFWSAAFGARTEDPSVEKILIAITNSPAIPKDQLISLASDFHSTGTKIHIICVNVCQERVNLPIVVRRGVVDNMVDKSLAQELKQELNCNPCYPDPCNGRGICKPLEGDKTHECTCTSNFIGESCEDQASDSFCDANPLKCENGGLCVDGPLGSYRCACTNNCHGFHCKQCEERPRSDNDEYQACLPNPCLNGCNCIPSCRNADGYICQSSNGFFGKNCSIPVPDVSCESDVITISVPAEFAEEINSGFDDSYIYVAPEYDADVKESVCTAVLRNGLFQTHIPLPFTSCEMAMEGQEKEGKLVMSNTVWLGRRMQSAALSMPVPVVQFECMYDRDYRVVSSLESVVDERKLRIRSSGKYNASAEMCKVIEKCAQPCPRHLMVKNAATYTIGEMMHIKMKIGRGRRAADVYNSTVVLVEAHLTCGGSSDPAVSLVQRGCRTLVLPTTISMDKASDSVCLSFQTPRLFSCDLFYVKVALRVASNRHLQSCRDGHGLQIIPTGRRRREVSEDGSDAVELERIDIGPVLVRRAKLAGERSVKILPETTSTFKVKGWQPFVVISVAVSTAIIFLSLVSCVVASCRIKSSSCKIGAISQT